LIIDPKVNSTKSKNDIIVDDVDVDLLLPDPRLKHIKIAASFAPLQSDKELLLLLHPSNDILNINKKMFTKEEFIPSCNNSLSSSNFSIRNWVKPIK
jgi:hypothetical protein